MINQESAEIAAKFAQITTAYEAAEAAEKTLAAAKEQLNEINIQLDMMSNMTDLEYMQSTGHELMPSYMEKNTLREREQQAKYEFALANNESVRAETTVRDMIDDITIEEAYTNLSIASEKYNDTLARCQRAQKLCAKKLAAYNDAGNAVTKSIENDGMAEPYQQASEEWSKAEDALKALEQELVMMGKEVQYGSLFLEMKREALEKVRADDMSYVVHSARLYCPYGLRPSILGLTISNGVFINGYPQLTIADNRPNLNIMNFGGCRNPNNPSTIKAANRARDVSVSSASKSDQLVARGISSDNRDVDDSVREISVGECNLTFQEHWSGGHDKVFINDKPALLRRSQLICEYGGVIILETSGQPEV